MSFSSSAVDRCGRRSPLLRTPLPQSDTARRISFKDFLYAGSSTLSDCGTYVTCFSRQCPQADRQAAQRRLEGARTDLGSPAGRHRTIASVARAWGFSDPSFFSSRFRRRYGVTPRQRQQHIPPHAARRKP
jgi:AraC-like DNA-binding protein